MIKKIDSQLSEYDAKVGSSLQMISCDPQGRISVEDLQKALKVIKHQPDEVVGQKVIEKLDVDKDGFVELEHVLGLVKEEGLGQSATPLACSVKSRKLTKTPGYSGIVLDGEAKDLIGEGKELKASKPRKEDIVQE